MTRFARQIVLREVGLQGQAAIERAPLVLPPHIDPFVAGIARAYGEGAGLGSAVTGPTLHSSWLPRLRHSEAQHVAEGAALALESLLRALETVPKTPTK